MSKRMMVIGAALVLAATGLARADAPGFGPDDVVKARQSGMLLSAADLGAIRRIADTGAEPKSLGFQAGALKHWAATLPIMFPAGTGPGQIKGATEARAEIWSDRAGFDKALAGYIEATSKLADLAKANDAPGFKAQAAAVAASCKSCHTAYRLEAKH